MANETKVDLVSPEGKQCYVAMECEDLRQKHSRYINYGKIVSIEN